MRSKRTHKKIVEKEKEKLVKKRRARYSCPVDDISAALKVNFLEYKCFLIVRCFNTYL